MIKIRKHTKLSFYWTCKTAAKRSSCCVFNEPTPLCAVFSVVAASAVGGLELWRKSMRESVMWIQCGLQLSGEPSWPVCLLVGKSTIMAVNGTTGESFSTSDGAFCQRWQSVDSKNTGCAFSGKLRISTFRSFLFIYKLNDLFKTKKTNRFFVRVIGM